MALNPQQLKDLLCRSQKGDSKAYHQFLSLISKAIELKVKKKVFAVDDQEDLIQVILMSIHQSLASYDSNREVLPWVATIAERRIIDYIRKYSRIKNHEFLSPDGDVTYHPDVAKNDIRGDLSEMLEELPDKIKDPIKMTKIEGLSTKEAAAALGIKENALRTRISRGINILKKKFSEEQ